MVVPFVAALAKYLPNLPDWAVGTCIAVVMALILGVVFAIVKMAQQQVEVIVINDELQFTFKARNRLTPVNFNVSLQQLENFYVGANKAGVYISIKQKTAPFNYNLGYASTSEAETEQFAACLNDLNAMVQAYNRANAGAPIKTDNPNGPLFAQVIFWMVVLIVLFTAVTMLVI